MILNNLTMAGSDGEIVNIEITGEKIASVSGTALVGESDEPSLTFEHALVFPGLINSHDHLDFNLFPLLGNKTYNNYTEWAKYIHEQYKDEIAAVLQIPVNLRSEWGAFKNLLCGVTTVINHGEASGLSNDLITIVEDAQCLHSVQFEKRWKWKLNNPRHAALPVNIHIGEGGDWLSFSEIDSLIKWNLLRRKLIGVHGVAMSDSQAKSFKALVWCPQSNYFLLNKTAAVDRLKNNTAILFGTDSTLTGNWNVWEHLRDARITGMLSDEELYQTINQDAADIWKLNSGIITEGKDADLVVAKIKKGLKGLDKFFELAPADLLLVLHRGQIRLFDERILSLLTDIDLSGYSKIYMDGACKYVQGNLPELMERIHAHYPKAIFPVSIKMAV